MTREDATAAWERMVDDVISSLDAWATRAAAGILPRPPGTQRKDPEEAHEEWRSLKDDVAALSSILQARAQVLGPERAALEMLLWDERHRSIEEGRKRGHTQDTAAEEGAEADNLQGGWAPQEPGGAPGQEDTGL